MAQDFASISAGDTLDPFVFALENMDGSPKDLTGGTATLTLRLKSGGAPAMDKVPHTNTPGTLGEFAFQQTLAQVSVRGLYEAEMVFQLGGEQKTVTSDLKIE